MSTATVPTPAEVVGLIRAAEARLKELDFVPDFTIEDYPIGSNNRGKCKLEVEWKKGKGWRTVRTTTDKYGRWCKPKCSTYDNTPIAVVKLDGFYEAAWLRCQPSYGKHAIYLQGANGDLVETILEHPDGVPTSRPRREPHTYTMESRDLYGKLIDSKEYTTPADSPEACDAWEVWAPGLQHLMQMIMDRKAAV